MTDSSCGIPVVDLFAGPGGLGEGFAAFRFAENARAFDIRLSIEKENFAHQSLTLRHFYRQFPDSNAPEEYYECLRNCASPLSQRMEDLFAQFPQQAAKAKTQAWRKELSGKTRNVVREKISRSLENGRNWVLLGGPPCQAYSVIGRWQSIQNWHGYHPEKDTRQYLYMEYLHVLADCRPAVFVMENVKGLLSAKLHNRNIFDKIVKDLESPVLATQKAGNRYLAAKKEFRYRIYSLVHRGIYRDSTSPGNFVVKMENHGIPQSRHRVIILGVRDDLKGEPDALIPKGNLIPVKNVLSGLPRLRSGLSGQSDNAKKWREEVTRAFSISQVRRLMTENSTSSQLQIPLPRYGRGGEFIPYIAGVGCLNEWYVDPRLGGVINHSTRSHIAEDLRRYFFVAYFGKAKGRSPLLSDFPIALLPRHKSAKRSPDGNCFADRFRVQVSKNPATTVISHISKDGHYYIHHDPFQCRSLTVREAARLQTFPDNYFFCGPRTAQYIQVGNAVPPLLAKQIAEIVYNLLDKK